jgi:hypothetical protein
LEINKTVEPIITKETPVGDLHRTSKRRWKDVVSRVYRLREHHRVDWDDLFDFDAHSARTTGVVCAIADLAGDVVDGAADAPDDGCDSDDDAERKWKANQDLQAVRMKKEFLKCVLHKGQFYKLPRPGKDPIVFQVLRTVQQKWVYVKPIRTASAPGEFSVLAQEMRPFDGREDCVFADVEADHINMCSLTSWGHVMNDMLTFDQAAADVDGCIALTNGRRAPFPSALENGSPACIVLRELYRIGWRGSKDVQRHVQDGPKLFCLRDLASKRSYMLCLLRFQSILDIGAQSLTPILMQDPL